MTHHATVELDLICAKVRARGVASREDLFRAEAVAYRVFTFAQGEHARRQPMPWSDFCDALPALGERPRVRAFGDVWVVRCCRCGPDVIWTCGTWAQAMETAHEHAQDCAPHAASPARLHRRATTMED